jgi:G3E family GTPase
LSALSPILSKLTKAREESKIHYELASVIFVMDPTAKSEHQLPVWKKHHRFVDAVIFSKTDLASQDQFAFWKTQVVTLRSNLRIWNAQQKLPWKIWIDAPKPTLSMANDNPQDLPIPYSNGRRFFQAAEHHEMMVWEWQSERVLDPEKFGKVLKSLETTILRAKGILNLNTDIAGDYKYLLQYTPAACQLYSQFWQTGETRQNHLVWIGTNFSATKLQEQLEGCLWN